MIKLIKNNKTEIIICLIFLFYAFGYNIYRVQGDGLWNFAFLERILNIPNPESSTEMLNKAILFRQRGSAYFDMPFYLIAYLIESVFHLNINFNGITLRQIAINIASNFYIALSLILVIKTLRLLKLKSIFFPVISILVSTSALAVGTIMPSWSHSIDVFINTLLIYFVVKNQQENPVKLIWAGILYILAVLTRYLNFILVLPIILYYMFQKDFKRLKFFILGIISVSWLLPLLLYVYNGSISPFYKTGLIVEPLNTINPLNTIGIPLFPKYALNLLFNPLHGLFIWAPITIFSLLGLIFSQSNFRKLSYLFISLWALVVLLYGFMPFWYAGWSFTNRYLVSLFPIYVIGLSFFIDKYGRKTLWFLIPLTIYSIILFLNWHLCIINGEFGVPTDILKAWTSGYSVSFIDKTVSINTFANRLWEMSRYKYLIRIL